MMFGNSLPHLGVGGEEKAPDDGMETSGCTYSSRISSVLSSTLQYPLPPTPQHRAGCEEIIFPRVILRTLFFFFLLSNYAENYFAYY